MEYSLKPQPDSRTYSIILNIILSGYFQHLCFYHELLQFDVVIHMTYTSGERKLRQNKQISFIYIINAINVPLILYLRNKLGMDYKAHNMFLR